MDDSSDSYLKCFEIRFNNKPLKRKQDDVDFSGIEAMLKRRKEPKRTMRLSSSSTSKMFWTKNHELDILQGILEYEKEKEVSYRSDWDVFYCFMKDLIDTDFSKQQLNDKDECVSYVKMEKEKNEEEGVDVLYVLQDALKALNPTLSENQHKFLCQDLQKHTVQRRKELTDEWKSLLDEDTKLNIKKYTFSLKLTNPETST